MNFYSEGLRLLQTITPPAPRADTPEDHFCFSKRSEYSDEYSASARLASVLNTTRELLDEAMERLERILEENGLERTTLLKESE